MMAFKCGASNVRVFRIQSPPLRMWRGINQWIKRNFQVVLITDLNGLGRGREWSLAGNYQYERWDTIIEISDNVNSISFSLHTFHFSFSLRPTSISTDIKVAFCPTKWFCSLSQELDRSCCYKSGTLLIMMESFSHIAVAHKTWLDVYCVDNALELGGIWNWICNHKNMYLIHLIFIKL